VRMRYVVASFQGDAYVYIPTIYWHNAACAVRCGSVLRCGVELCWSGLVLPAEPVGAETETGRVGLWSEAMSTGGGHRRPALSRYSLQPVRRKAAQHLTGIVSERRVVMRNA
jgi:hypothetical protein